jgi:adenine-specific DNA-methyltransferase
MTAPQSPATIQPIDKASPEAQSANLVEGNLAQLKALFPEAFTEGRVEFEVLKQLLGAAVDEREEKYGLNWHGKRRARQLALTPSTGTLRPCPDESVDWDTTQNLFIEGDNLEVLKLLQKSYAGKVKLIYIDPPYNTGKDFVYPDNFQDSIKNYMELTGQVEGGQKISSNTDASGRFHTDWLNMMYPRLKLARALIRDDGAIFVSCDDGEVANLRHLLDEIFGEECFVAQFVWKARKFTDARANTNVSTDHEYLIAYAKSPEFSLRGIERDESKFSNPDGDPRGPWMSRSLLGLATIEQRPNLHYVLEEPGTGRRFEPDPSTGWRYSKERMLQLINSGAILFPRKDEGRPREKKFRSEMQDEFIAFRSIIEGAHTADGTAEIRECFGEDVFTFPKPVELIRQIVEQVSGPEDICLDFFAGSGTTGAAVALQNQRDGGSRRFVLVQLPEPLLVENREQAVAAKYLERLGKPKTVSQLTVERLRRVAVDLRAKSPALVSDIGFRSFRLDSSNIRAWTPRPDDLTGTLLDHAEHLAPGRSEQDVLYELLLKLGLDLAVPMESRQIAGKTVHSIGAGALMACLSDGIGPDVAEPLALGIAEWQKAQAQALQGGDDNAKPVSTKLVFKDSAFADDVAKTNLAAILSQHGLDDVRSI